MFYYKVFIPRVSQLFTWHSDQSITPGQLVEVPYRRKTVCGMIYQSVDKPIFETRPIEKIHERQLTNPLLSLAQKLSQETFCSLSESLETVTDKIFWELESRLDWQAWYQLTAAAQVEVNDQESISTLLGKRLGPKEKEVISVLLQNPEPLDEKKAKQNFSSAVLKRLVDKNIIELKTAGLKSPQKSVPTEPLVKLTDHQTKALQILKKSSNTVLLHGVTGSGKTEVYKHFLSINPQAQHLVLLPEIMLTPQLIESFQRAFGDLVDVWHSQLPLTQRRQTWHRVLRSESKVIVGTRSALFLPFQNLQTIILDEEHEWTYKNEHTPRYWAHDVAHWYKAFFPELKIILGSATPRAETWAQAQVGKYDLATLSERVFKSQPPVLQIIDLKKAQEHHNYSPLSDDLHQSIELALEAGKKILLFLNKRGFNSGAFCRACGEKFQCPRCNTPFTVHGQNHTQKFVCHSCGTIASVPDQCWACKRTDFRFYGWGTQQVQDELTRYFPDARVIRADQDTIKSRHDHAHLYETFKTDQADILLGTQMISKGLDFANIGLIGFIQADVGIQLPDFRMEERTFALLHQVIGRAGRRGEKTEVVLQTFFPEHEMFEHLTPAGFKTYLQKMLERRQQYHLPPHGSFLKGILKNKDKMAVYRETVALYEQLLQIKTDIQNKIPDFWCEITWAPAFFPKRNLQYFFHVFVQTKNSQDLKTFWQEIPPVSGVKWDRDPGVML